jgi:hypothetical protein
MVKVKVSAKSAHLHFHGCDPQYIADVCHGRCCEGSNGLMVSVHKTEIAALEMYGVTFSRPPGMVVDSLLLVPRNPEKRGSAQLCSFKTSKHLCSLHGAGPKPFGCVASPFTLNKNNTLIVRNRYKLLRCYNDGPRFPAYVAFRASLDLIFGTTESARICTHLAEGGGDIVAEMTELNWCILRDNDAAKPKVVG